MSGVLYVIATPIGNLEDLSPRAARILGEVSLVAAEDTRVTRKLLSHLQLQTRLISFHSHSTMKRLDDILRALGEGQSVALVTDAGSPTISDPGRELIALAAEQDIPITPIPGPSAVTAALMAAGLRGSGHRFVGFLPRGSKERQEALNRLRHEPAVCVLFESRERLDSLLAQATEAFGPERRAVVCRELTKFHEEFIRGRLGDLRSRSIDPRGEITLVLEGAMEPSAEAGDSVPLEEWLRAALSRGESVRDAVQSAVRDLGVPRGLAYATALRIRPEPTALGTDDDSDKAR